ncbi:MAG: penicillin acylase family protein [Planctomycetaceae bacterium]|nr:MAG: penicillin acylase family protein [Planctomycetaceae bacterium]
MSGVCGRLISGFLLLLVTGLVGWGAPSAAADSASEAGLVESVTLSVAGLEDPVEVRIDRWGVPHIYAESEADLFFAQGYYVAHERLFQLELWRRRATGTAAEILGEREVDADVGARLMRYRGDAEREWAHYHPRGKEILNSFVRGINARVDEVLADADLLPLEFRMIGALPGHWTPEVVVSRHQGLVRNVTEELGLGRAVAEAGPEAVGDWVWFHPGRPDLTLDPVIDGEGLKADILKLYRAARAPIRFRPADVLDEFRKPAESTSAVVSVGEPDGRELAETSGFGEADGRIDWQSIGSNNWVVGPERTLDGSTFMANDPHRVLQAPSLRYFVHLVAPGWDVIGGGEPALPGVSIGHNRHGAWGLTIFAIDSEDLYVYQTAPSDPNRYRYGDGWESMRVETERFVVKGEAEPRVIDLKFTRHGPVLHEDPERGVAYALRAAWLETGGAPYLASLRMDQAESWEEFREACSFSHIPGENMVWADTAGNIGWQAVGIAPRRPNWDGLVPVPGDGRFEWDGYLPIRQLPNLANPSKGFWNTSNEALVPRGYPHRRSVGWTWADPFRGARVQEVLGSGRKLDMGDMMRLQQDELSLPARSLVPLLPAGEFSSDRVRQAAFRLRSWDFVLKAESVTAGIYVAWQRQVRDAVTELLVPEGLRPQIGELSMKRVIDRLHAPDGRFGDDPIAGRDALLVGAFERAVAELTERFGPRILRWRYGQEGYKHALIRHPLSDAVNEEYRKRLDVGPVARGGDGFTVNNTGGADNQPTGASFRVILNTSRWDESVATSSPGQGGDPEGPHYRDLFEMWGTGSYFPLLYSRPRVEGVTRQRWEMRPEQDR